MEALEERRDGDARPLEKVINCGSVAVFSGKKEGVQKAGLKNRSHEGRCRGVGGLGRKNNEPLPSQVKRGGEKNLRVGVGRTGNLLDAIRRFQGKKLNNSITVSGGVKRRGIRRAPKGLASVHWDANQRRSVMFKGDSREREGNVEGVSERGAKLGALGTKRGNPLSA